jgi:hypothetical protein
MYLFPCSEFYKSIRLTVGNNLRVYLLGRLRNKCGTGKDRDILLE